MGLRQSRNFKNNKDQRYAANAKLKGQKQFRSFVLQVECIPLAIDHLAVLGDRHIDAGAAFGIDQFNRLRHGVRIFPAMFRRFEPGEAELILFLTGRDCPGRALRQRLRIRRGSCAPKPAACRPWAVHFGRMQLPKSRSRRERVKSSLSFPLRLQPGFGCEQRTWREPFAPRFSYAR